MIKRSTLKAPCIFPCDGFEQCCEADTLRCQLGGRAAQTDNNRLYYHARWLGQALTPELGKSLANSEGQKTDGSTDFGSRYRALTFPDNSLI